MSIIFSQDLFLDARIRTHRLVGTGVPLKWIAMATPSTDIGDIARMKLVNPKLCLYFLASKIFRCTFGTLMKTM